MTQLWSYRGKAQKGIPAIDSRFHYLNHYDIFGDLVALYNSRIYNCNEGSDDIAGVILAIWNDRLVVPERNIILENNFYPAMLAIAERSWLGGGHEYFDGKGTILPADNTPAFIDFTDFEKRMLWHKEHNFREYPFAYVRQTDIRWNITDPFPNEGDLSRSFPPEQALQTHYQYKAQTYNVHPAIGAGIYLRHVWGTLVPGFFCNPQENHTAYAWTWVYSPKNQETGLWIEFQNYGRSEKDLPPLPGKWDYRESRIWLNNAEIQPPEWTATHRTPSNETALGNENCVARPPLIVKLHKGWNNVFLKLPIGRFSTPEIRLQKWMFTVVFVTPDGRKKIRTPEVKYAQPEQIMYPEYDNDGLYPTGKSYLFINISLLYLISTNNENDLSLSHFFILPVGNLCRTKNQSKLYRQQRNLRISAARTGSKRIPGTIAAVIGRKIHRRQFR